MGQSTSRNRSQTPSSSSTPRAREPNLPQEDSSSSRDQSNPASEVPPNTKRFRRSSLRRSILGLIPNGSSSSSSSSSSARAAKENGASSSSEGHHSLRKRWRSSRRWSKAPAELAELTPPAQEAAVVSNDREGATVAASSLGVADVVPIGTPSNTSLLTAPSPASRSSSPHLEAHVQGPSEGPSEDDRQLGENTSSLAAGASPSHTHETLRADPASAPSRHPSAEDIEREVNEFLNGRADHTDGDIPVLEAAIDGPSEHTEAPTQQLPSPRHYPSPGPLVVVQGVVNTTDSPHAASQTSHLAQNAANTTRPAAATQSQAVPISRRRSLSIPRPASRANAVDERHRRHRLTSLIRPTSMLGRGQLESGSRGPPTSLSTPEFNPSDASASNREPISPPNVSSAASVSEVQAPPAQDNNSGSRGLSQGSIDVLGTLLSVAAAATAASLFSPGLPHNGINGGIAPLSTGARPLSPTPTAGLGALGGFGGMPGLGLNPAVAHSSPGAPQDSRDRIRNMWESIRERVGLNPRTPIAPVAGVNAERQGQGDDVGAADRQRMRPGELMLAEMARALNAGLGLANSGERRTADPAGAADTAGNNMMFAPIWDANQPLPPEGSFERFLVNLQADLRTVLGDEGSATATDNARSATVSASGLVGPSAAASEASHTPEATTETADLPDQEDDEGDMPPTLTEDSDSEDGTDEDEDERDEDEDDAEDSSSEQQTHPTPRTPTPIPPAGGVSFGPEPRSTAGNAGVRADEASRPAINLWRLYRFDPILAVQPQEQIVRAASSPAPENASVLQPPPLVETTATPESANIDIPIELPEAGPSQPSARAQPANVVVPVIVVGLQSVDVPGQDEHDEEPPMPADLQNGAIPSNEAYNELPTQDGASGRSASRGRTWQSRAANALRTLRPGRRATSHGRRASEGSGSRTFLIYVIGGYYPPNHHMVTGSDTLDSYEALWELADLLGQVKPPTATREDIDKSGLQIIKASDVTRYEQEGRIASNCVERCLICLDDYDADDDLRLMSCRHTFHKDCVDKWLQVGRNNCPACRTKGVSVSESSPTMPTTSTGSQTTSPA